MGKEPTPNFDEMIPEVPRETKLAIGQKVMNYVRGIPSGTELPETARERLKRLRVEAKNELNEAIDRFNDEDLSRFKELNALDRACHNVELLPEILGQMSSLNRYLQENDTADSLEVSRRQFFGPEVRYGEGGLFERTSELTPGGIYGPYKTVVDIPLSPDSLRRAYEYEKMGPINALSISPEKLLKRVRKEL